MTGGENQRQDEEDWRNWYVAKRILVSAIAVTLQQGRLQVAQQLEHASTWAREAQNFQFRVTRNNNDQYGAWREGEHDDLLFAVGLIVWYGESTKPFPNQARSFRQTTAEGPGSPHSRMNRREVDTTAVQNPSVWRR